jgi:hypothetical protein
MDISSGGNKMRAPGNQRKRKHSAKTIAGRIRTRLGILLGVVAAASILIVSLGGGTAVSASANDGQGQTKAKRYKATRAFVVDKQTGQVRMPTQQEVDEVVANLSDLGQRPAESLPQAAHANGAVSVDLDGGFGGVLLGRPNDDGTWQTKCVFTLEEGAEFLGLVEDDSTR